MSEAQIEEEKDQEWMAAAYLDQGSPLFGCGNTHVITRAKNLGFNDICKGQ